MGASVSGQDIRYAAEFVCASLLIIGLLALVCLPTTREESAPRVMRRKTRQWSKRSDDGVPMVPPGSQEEPTLLQGAREFARSSTRKWTVGLSPFRAGRTEAEGEDEDDESDDSDERDGEEGEYIYSNIVWCPEGHPMNAKVIREVLGRVPCHPKRNCEPRWSECSECGEEISKDASKYRCKACKITYCADCCRKKLGLRTARSGGEGSSCLEIIPGDIALIGPDVVGIHHVVLVTSDLRPEEPSVGWVLDLEPGIEVWSCDTIESVQSATGEDWWWYPARSYFGRDPYNGEAHLVADMPQRKGEIEAIEPVPLKILLHPLREEFRGPGVDLAQWAKAVDDGAKNSKQYSYATRFNMAVAYLLQQTPLQNAAIDTRRFPTLETREQLLDAIKASWERPPICSTVAIQTWQRYLVDAYADEDAATQAILRYMPLFCHTTLPATLAKELTKFGWVLCDNFEV